MVKLIDAKWLKKYVRNVGIYCDTDADKEYTCEKIDKFPTVEAIPVEWLKKKYPFHGVAGTEMYFRKAHAVEDILKDWELEKEKRKEK